MPAQNWNGRRNDIRLPHVVIVGGGFAGLACAKRLGDAPIDVTLIDRRNHNLFQPLLYQVATAALSPADIAEPIRRTLSRYENINVELGEATGIDADAKRLQVDGVRQVDYDYLVLATGSDYNYFSNERWRSLAPGLKTLREARAIRQKLLTAFEMAELTESAAERKRYMTTLIVGGGPTGVEMAGAVSELGRFMIVRDYHKIALDDLTVILVEAGPRILSGFPEDLSLYATRYLKKIGVEVRTEARVTDIGSDSAVVSGERIGCGCIIWGAGIKASDAARWLDLSHRDKLGRVPVTQDLRVPGFPNIFSIGDTALFLANGEPLPALAQVAKQQGEHLGNGLRKLLGDHTPLGDFAFHDRGNTAVVGRHAAIFDFGRFKLKGRFAWFLWAIVHVYLLINFEKRVLVSIQWIVRYITRQRGARIIDEAVEAADEQSEMERSGVR